MNFAGYIQIVAIHEHLLQLESSGNEHSEYVRIAFVREWILSKTSTDASNQLKKCGYTSVVFFVPFVVSSTNYVSKFC